MTQIKIGDKTLIIEDGVNVEMAGDEIRLKPGAPQPAYIPIAVPYQQPYAPIYPTPYFIPDPWGRPTITCGREVSPLIVGDGVVPLAVGNSLFSDANGDGPYSIGCVRTQ